MSIFVYPQPGIADIAPLAYKSAPTGGGASLKHDHPYIRMESEEVIVRLKPQNYSVDAVFHMVNSGETATEWVGFPKQGRGLTPALDDVEDYLQFGVWVDGQQTRFSEKREVGVLSYFLKGWYAIALNRPRGFVEDFRWMIGKIRFPGNKKTIIRVNYEANYDQYGMGPSKAAYIYGTGRYWKGTIGKASFVIDGSAIGGVDHFTISLIGSGGTYVSNQRRISKYIVRHEMRNLEPNPHDRLLLQPKQ